MNQRPVFFVGNTENASEVGGAISELGLPLERLAHAGQLRSALEDTEPMAVFTPAGGALLAEVCLALRSHARFSRVPAFGVTPADCTVSSQKAGAPSDLTFIELFQAGGDDLVPAHRTAVLRRMRPLMNRLSGETPGRREGVAIVAGADRVWRSILGRTLFNGGLTVRFCDDPRVALAEGAQGNVKLVVIADEARADGAAEPAESAAELVARARGEGQTAPWIVVAPPRRLARIGEELRCLEKAAVADAFAPPENVLFLANELSRPRTTDNRATPRSLFGTRVAFRVAGREEDEVGFTYNVSEGGLYVRTAAPVEPNDDVWLELWPPRSERRVRLAGSVAWRRHLGPNDFATVPAGFGVKLTDGLAGDLERWQQGCRAYASHLGGSREP